MRGASIIPDAMRAARRMAEWIRSAAGRSFVGGLAAGAYAVLFWHSFAARFGGAPTIQAGAFAAITVGLVGGAIGARKLNPGGRAQSIVAGLLVAAWAAAFGPLCDAAAVCFQFVDLDVLASPFAQCAAGFGGALVLFAVPTAFAARFGFANPALRSGWLLVGIATGLLATVHVIGPWLALQWAAGLGAVCLLTVIANSFRRTIGSAQPALPDPLPITGAAKSVLACVVVGGAGGAR